MKGIFLALVSRSLRREMKHPRESAPAPQNRPGTLGPRGHCPPLPWVLCMGARGGLSQTERVTRGQIARPKRSSGTASFDAKKPHGTNRLGPRCLWRSPYGGRAGSPGQSMCPSMQCSYVLLRHVDDRPWGSGGSREAWLPHSILPWVALEESFPWGLNCSPARTWRGFRCPRGVRRRLRAEHSGPQAPTPGRAGSEPGSRPSLCATWAGPGQRAAPPALLCTCHPSTDTRQPPQTHFLSLGPFLSFWSLWRQEGNRSS